MPGDCPSLCGSQSCTNWQQLRQHPIVTTWVFDDLSRWECDPSYRYASLEWPFQRPLEYHSSLCLDSVLDIKA